mgnify:CR=1 FL=1
MPYFFLLFSSIVRWLIKHQILRKIIYLLSQIIQKIICQLPQDFMVVIVFRDIQELSYEDISTIIEVPIGTVKSRINRGREKLRQLLNEKGINLNEC